MRRRSDSLLISRLKTATMAWLVDGGVLGDVDGEGGFAHGGAGGDDDELAFLQAAGHAVEAQ